MALAVELTPLAPYLDGPAALRVEAGATVADVLGLLGIELPGGTAVGVWGRKTGLERVLRDGDRMEFYRPLVNDPKAARQQRVARQRGAGVLR